MKGERFEGWRQVGHVQQAARVHAARGVDELLILDIDATPRGTGVDTEAIQALTAACFMPLAVGGGVRSLEDVRALLNAGADRVVIGTAAIEDPFLVQQISRVVGSQAVSVAIDHKAGRVYTRCGKHDTGYSPATVAIVMQAMGAGEIILTSIEREGTMTGYDTATLADVACHLSVPLVAHGGAGTYAHMLEAMRAGANAVAAGAMFQFTDATPRGAAQFLQREGIEVRL